MPSLRRSRGSSRRSRPEDLEHQEPGWTEFDLYRSAVDEYRFQVNLNWSRTQYFIALNLAVFGLAATLLAGAVGDLAGIGAAALFGVGLLCSVLALAAGRVQRSYYHSARDRMLALEQRLGLDEHATVTTPGMRGVTRRLGKVHQAHTLIVGSVLALDVAGLVTAVSLQVA